ncbi:hypothetical protein, partial [Escherichia coli]|uniref:hypothetical protein n=1 Tax=Escherichia coli TaxID=562 RepID=UPI001F4B9650
FSRNVSLGGFQFWIGHISKLRDDFCSACIDGCFPQTIPMSLQFRKLSIARFYIAVVPNTVSDCFGDTFHFLFPHRYR